jgi:hypothetical protein
VRYPKSLRIYIAGPMRHKPAFNFPAFAEARTALARTGHHVFSPADRDLANGFDPAGMTGDEDLAKLGFDLRAALALDSAWICANAEAIALLPGWETSSGARAELALAAALGLQAGSVQDFADGTLAPAGQVLSGAGVAPLAPSGTLLPEPVVHLVAPEPGRTVNPAPAQQSAPQPRAAPVLVQATATSGEVRVTSSTGGQKGTKIARFDLIPAGALRELAEHYGRGAVKYERVNGLDNWRNGYSWSLSYAALHRHLNAFWSGEDIDEETGSKHLVAAAWHCMTLIEFMNRLDLAGFDDRQDVLSLHAPLAAA